MPQQVKNGGKVARTGELEPPTSGPPCVIFRLRWPVGGFPGQLSAAAGRPMAASFTDYDLGYFDLETRVLEPLANPFCPRLLPM
jgi:hypothetical protein